MREAVLCREGASLARRLWNGVVKQRRRQAARKRNCACAAPIPAIQPLLGIKLLPVTDARFEWPALPAASGGYNVWRAARKQDIPDLRAPPLPTITPVCVPTIVPSCVDPQPPSPGTCFYYQVRGRCGANEGA